VRFTAVRRRDAAGARLFFRLRRGGARFKLCA